MGMHFKLGLYEHQSAGVLEGIQKLIFDTKFNDSGNPDIISKIKIVAYEPAFGIIGDPAKRSATTRQSADHSMVYIVSTMLRKAFEDKKAREIIKNANNLDEVWKALMLEPKDYGYQAIINPVTRTLINKTEFEHGGKEYDDKYPEGIPSSIVITLNDGKVLDSKFVMFPSGHARNTNANLKDILNHKFKLLGSLALSHDKINPFIDQLNNIENLTNAELQTIYNCNIKYSKVSVDDKEFK
jgi:2-methylcitrate dehydratase